MLTIYIERDVYIYLVSRRMLSLEKSLGKISEGGSACDTSLLWDESASFRSLIHIHLFHFSFVFPIVFMHLES